MARTRSTGCSTVTAWMPAAREVAHHVGCSKARSSSSGLHASGQQHPGPQPLYVHRCTFRYSTVMSAHLTDTMLSGAVPNSWAARPVQMRVRQGRGNWQDVRWWQDTVALTRKVS